MILNAQYINLAQIIVSIILIVLILLQQSGSALGSAFGQDGGGFYSTRRGAQKTIYIASIIFGIAFVAISLLNLLY